MADSFNYQAALDRAFSPLETLAAGEVDIARRNLARRQYLEDLYRQASMEEQRTSRNQAFQKSLAEQSQDFQTKLEDVRAKNQKNYLQESDRLLTAREEARDARALRDKLISDARVLGWAPEDKMSNNDIAQENNKIAVKSINSLLSQASNTSKKIEDIIAKSSPNLEKLALQKLAFAYPKLSKGQRDLLLSGQPGAFSTVYNQILKTGFWGNNTDGAQAFNLAYQSSLDEAAKDSKDKLALEIPGKIRAEHDTLQMIQGAIQRVMPYVPTKDYSNIRFSPAEPEGPPAPDIDPNAIMGSQKATAPSAAVAPSARAYDSATESTEPFLSRVGSKGLLPAISEAVAPAVKNAYGALDLGMTGAGAILNQQRNLFLGGGVPPFASHFTPDQVALATELGARAGNVADKINSFRAPYTPAGAAAGVASAMRPPPAPSGPTPIGGNPAAAVQGYAPWADYGVDYSVTPQEGDMMRALAIQEGWTDSDINNVLERAKKGDTNAIQMIMSYRDRVRGNPQPNRPYSQPTVIP